MFVSFWKWSCLGWLTVYCFFCFLSSLCGRETDLKRHFGSQWEVCTTYVASSNILYCLRTGLEMKFPRPIRLHNLWRFIWEYTLQKRSNTSLSHQGRTHIERWNPSTLEILHEQKVMLTRHNVKGSQSLETPSPPPCWVREQYSLIRKWSGILSLNQSSRSTNWERESLSRRNHLSCQPYVSIVNALVSPSGHRHQLSFPSNLLRREFFCQCSC